MPSSLLCTRKLDTSLVRHVGLAPLFKAQARLHGPVTAIEYGEYAISYEELHLKALHLAQLIRLQAPEPGTPIAIAIPRGVNHILAQIAISYAGGTCVPLDIKQPDAFLRKLIKNLDVKLALVDGKNWSRALETDNMLIAHTLKPQISDEDFEVSSNGPSSCSHILHTSGTTILIQPEPLDLQEAFDLISGQCSRPLQGISFSRWLEMFADDATNPLHPFLPLFQEEIWGTHTRWGIQENAPRFEIDNTLRALHDSPDLLAWMPALDLLRKYIPEWSAVSSDL